MTRGPIAQELQRIGFEFEEAYGGWQERRYGSSLLTGLCLRFLSCGLSKRGSGGLKVGEMESNLVGAEFWLGWSAVWPVRG